MRSSLRSTSSRRPSVNVITTRLISFRAVSVDLLQVRTVHALHDSPCLFTPSKLGLNGVECRAVHYGLCSPVTYRPKTHRKTQIHSNRKASQSTITPIVAKLETYRDKIQAAIELLAVEEEPADLEALLRNFVKEDRRRQEAKKQSANELDSKRKIKVKSQPQIDILNNQRNDSTADKKVVFGVRTPPKESNESHTTQSLVQKRLSKFDSERHSSPSLSSASSHSSASTASSSEPALPALPSSLPLLDSSSSSSLSSSEKIVFGISPKSSSLSRYKTLIESRQSSSPPPSELDDNRDNSDGNGRDAVTQRKIIVSRSTPVSSRPEIDSPSAPSPPTQTAERQALTSAPILSAIDSKCAQSSLVSVPSNVSQRSAHMSPSPVKTFCESPSTPIIAAKSNTQNVSPKNELTIKHRNGKPRPVSAPESSIEQFIAQQLTDDEKALLQRTSRKSSKDDQHLTIKSALNGSSNKENSNGIKSKPTIDKPKPRIITLHKPIPKPEPKPAEPKFVNGKLVFGQVTVKPFLAKGSVAERVLLFEKCPEKTSVAKVKMLDNSGKSGVKMAQNKLNQWIRSPNDKKQNEVLALQRRFSRSNSLTGAYGSGTSITTLPRFYYPQGRPYSSHEVEMQICRITGVFDRFPSKTAGRKEFGAILKTVGIPLYWKEPLFRAVTNGNNGNRKAVIACEAFVDFWKKVITSCYDEASRFLKILTRGERNYFLPEDFVPLIQDVIDSHPGLAFLRDAEEFHSRYVHTVIARIYYCVNKSWSGKITLPELRKSNFLQVLSLLEEEEDINQVTDYFSYEHFYVIYCKFWELDKDHDLYISKFDLTKHNDSAISSRMIDRIFSGAVTRGAIRKDGKMSYAEFVWFLLSEEDKRHPRSIEYWFRCMDLDGDGYLSMYELEYFYSEQIKRMEAIGIEALPFNDCLCQMLDLVRPEEHERISLTDLKRCRLTPIFFDTFFNLEKYLDHEQRDPFASSRDEDGLAMSDWDRYAAEEYEILVAEENAQNNTNLLDFTGENGGANEFVIAAKRFGLRARSKDDDDYDYVDSDSDYSY